MEENSLLNILNIDADEFVAKSGNFSRWFVGMVMMKKPITAEAVAEQIRTNFTPEEMIFYTWVVLSDKTEEILKEMADRTIKGFKPNC